ncbi:IS200/IS605 family transposase [Cryomorpha ignava]|uniref:IS200/IS605 family transposase n=1 Tax=Cryomorpha ignava TaxID=101383 RepID=A0A7K3WSR7_9FLAO|nr:IS200/IS605 family transposase [Cryomorpha ignava]NEN24740.1 IS200/IS605 family transposase [Cryomorpha ignava]
MANTYSQLFIHAVFAVKYRKSILIDSVRHKALAIIGQQIKDADCTPLIVNGVEDHVHCLFNIPPKYAPSDILQKVKAKSSKDFNDERLFDSPFRWQGGSGLFSHSYREVDGIYQYIKNQEEHHRNVTFLEEFLLLLKDQNIDFDPDYLFDPLV